MEEQYYCPDCGNKLEVLAGCGSVSYFCNTCKLIISRKRIMTEAQLTEKISKMVIEELK
ncbi:MAG: zinc-ribbon domain-containing protein [Clostridiaceae bacterium]|nr:zinc-ribbon domain-containing protein [Clostridiaceae bacterium]